MPQMGALQRRLGMPDPRGPQGIMSRGANVYRGGMPNAQSGGGNPNIGRPPSGPGMGQPPPGGMSPGGPGIGRRPDPSLSALVGSLPPQNAMPQQPQMNDAMMNILKQKFAQKAGRFGAF